MLDKLIDNMIYIVCGFQTISTFLIGEDYRIQMLTSLAVCGETRRDSVDLNIQYEMFRFLNM